MVPKLTNIEKLHSDDKMREVSALVSSRVAERNNGGNGGGGGMSELAHRVTRIEEDLKELRADMKDARDRLKGLEVKVDHLPSKDFIVKTMVAGLSLLTAIIVFQEKLTTLFGVTS